MTLADWLDRSFQAYPQKLVNVRVTDLERRKGWAKCTPLRDLVDEAERSMAGEGRVLVRSSGTEPLLRVMVEASQTDVVELWTGRLAEAADRHLNVA